MTITHLPLLALCALCAAAPPAAAQQPPAEADYEARLTEAKGDVTVFTSEEPAGVPAEKDMPLAVGDKVRTGEDASAEVAFSGEHCVALRPNSELTLSDLRRSDLELGLSLGGLLAKVQSLLGGSFRVRTPAAVAAVRGTEFAAEVDAQSPDLAHFGVFDEGKVAVEAGGGAPEILKSNQETNVRRGGRPMPAYQLRRFTAQRQFMRTFRKRVGLMRKSWRPMAAARRQAARREALQRMRQMREQRRQQIQQTRERVLRGGRRMNKGGMRPDQEKMERRRRAVRERLRGGGN